VGDVPSTFCIPQGMPMMMNLYDPMEIVVTGALGIDPFPDRAARVGELGIGAGRYDKLQIETRTFKGPRAYDASEPTARSRQSERHQGTHLSRREGSEHPP
jgi:hypothetical protein